MGEFYDGHIYASHTDSDGKRHPADSSYSGTALTLDGWQRAMAFMDTVMKPEMGR